MYFVDKSFENKKEIFPLEANIVKCIELGLKK
jgi:hypothetical protein